MKSSWLSRKSPMKRTSMRREPRVGLSGTPVAVNPTRPEDPALPKSGKPRVRKPRLADPITTLVRRQVKLRADLKCEACWAFIGETGGHMHHRQSRRFGNHTAANIVYLDAACHQRAHRNRDGEAWARGWIVKSWEDPSLIPFVRWDEPRYTEKLR